MVACLGGALDVGEQVAERRGAKLPAGPLQPMRDAHRGGAVAAPNGLSESRGESGEILFELAHEAGEKIQLAGRALDLADLLHQRGVEQGARLAVHLAAMLDRNAEVHSEAP